MNNITLIGNVVADAEVKDVGKSKCIKVRVANNVGYGENKIVNWFYVDYFRNSDPTKLVDLLKKGKKIAVTGEFRARPWKDKEGNDKLSLEIFANNITLISDGGKPENTEKAAEKSNASTSHKSAKPAASDDDAF